MEGEAERRVRVGVTGHRVLAKAGRIRTGIDSALDGIERSFPGSSLDLLSCLAEGADRLVARRGLARRGARLTVPLPLSEAEYLEDFPSRRSRREFRSLLERAAEVVDLPPVTRPEAYQAAGLWILDHCDLLLAVWDGEPAHGAGGTGEIVEEARSRGLPIAWVHAGNRRPGTTEPTSLGKEQGRVTFEHLCDLPYRVRVAVAGGRLAADREAVRAAVRGALPSSIEGLFDEESRTLIRTARRTPLAFAVVTSLAGEGERLLARELLRLPGAALEAVLPGGEEEFLAGLAAPEERAEAAALLARSRAPVVDGKTGPGAGERVARRVVDRCDLLVQLAGDWVTGEGETPLLAQARARQRPVIRILPEGPAVERSHGLNARAIGRLDRFNAFNLSRKGHIRYVENLCKDLFGSEEGRRIAPAARRRIREKLLPHYVRASALAKRNQGWYRRAGQAVWCLFPLVLAAAALGALLPAVAPAAYAVEVTLLLLIFLVVHRADRLRSHEWWIECRFLTERIRSAIFLAVGGVEPASLRAPPYQGGEEHRDAWMVKAFNEIWERMPRSGGWSDTDCANVKAYLQSHWLEDQIRFHEGKAERSGRLSRNLERAGWLAFLMAIGVAAAHLVILWLHRGEEGHGFPGLTAAFLSILLPGVGAAFGGFRVHREYSRLARRSGNMAAELRELKEGMEAADDPESLEKIVREIENLTLGETQDWLTLMRFVPVEPPG